MNDLRRDWVGLRTLALCCLAPLLACGEVQDGGRGNAAAGAGGHGGAGGAAGIHGSSTGAPGTGGSQAGTAGAGGTAGRGTTGLGGTTVGIGGSTPGTGGSLPGTGGSLSGTGGSLPGTGGQAAGSGGTSGSLGGTGGSGAGAGGLTGGTAGATGMGGTTAGTGGATGTGGTTAGTGGVSAGTGGSTTGTGGSTTGGGGSTGGTGGVSANTIFVTSQTFSLTALAAKSLGAGAEAVLSGADTACAEAVSGAGSVAPAGTYVAWISSRALDASSRVITARGSTPRGWTRVDGRPVMDQIPVAGTATHIFYPVVLTELGQPTTNVWAWTGTDGLNQHVATSDCADWSSTSATVYGSVGLPTAGGTSWTGGVAAPCNSTLPVYCMQVDHAVPVAVPAASNAKRAFVSFPFTPSAGLAGADALCAHDAQSAGLTGTFRAVLATTTASAASRFHPTGSRPYARIDDVVVAAADSDLFQSSPKMLAPINVSVSGSFSIGSVLVGAMGISQVGTATCSDWSAVSGNVVLGTGNYTGAGAFGGYTGTCDDTTTIYCLED